MSKEADYGGLACVASLRPDTVLMAVIGLAFGPFDLLFSFRWQEDRDLQHAAMPTQSRLCCL